MVDPPTTVLPTTLREDPCCAVHPDRRQTFVCRRCGAFGCETCRAQPRDNLCRTCAARALTELSEPVTVAAVLGEAFRLPDHHWQSALGYFALSLLPVAVWAFLGDLVAGSTPDISPDLLRWARGPSYNLDELNQMLRPVWPRTAANLSAELVGWVLWLLGTGAFTVVAAESLRGRQLGFGGALSQTLRRLPTLIFANIAVLAAGCAGLVLCVIPGLFALLAGSLVDPAVLIGRRGPLSAYGTSARLALLAPGPLLLLIVFSLLGSMVLSTPLSIIASHLQSQAALQHVLYVLERAVGYAASLPVIAGVTYLYVRLWPRIERPGQ